MNYLLAALVLLLLVVVYVTKRQRRDLLPGPPSHPIIGHLLSMPSTQAPEVFHQWSKEYGGLFHLNGFEYVHHGT